MNNDDRKDDLQRPDDNRPGDLPKGNQEPTPKPPADDPGGADPGDVGPVLHVKLPEYDAELDPESPDFNPDKLARATGETAEQIQAALKDTLQGFRDKLNLNAAAVLEPIKEDFTRTIQESGLFEEIARQITEMAKAIIEIDGNKLQKALTLPVNIAGLIDKDLIREISETIIAATIEDYKSLEPFILEELNKAGKDADALATIYRESIDENGEIRPESPFFEILQRARAARKEKAPHSIAKRAEIVEYPLDKPNSKIWNLLEKDTKGQISFNMAPHGSGQKIPAYYAIDFEALHDVKITKRLLPFDKRVYIAISALFNAGNNVITLSQIYYAMGNTGTPGLQDYEKINDTITKLTSARIYFDNKAEAETLKGYARFKYDGSLLPVERGTAVINGKLSDAAIHIFREPPLITFAKQRKQITTIDIKLLQSPISKTDGNLLIDDYLIERISKAKGKGNSCRILKATIYKAVGISEHPKTNTEKSAKQRAPGKIKKYLTHYKKQDFIKDFSEDADGYTIRL